MYRKEEVAFIRFYEAITRIVFISEENQYEIFLFLLSISIRPFLLLRMNKCIDFGVAI